MSKRAIRDYLKEISDRYKIATKEEKKKILDEFCTVCVYNRKYAIKDIKQASYGSVKELWKG
jgi:hypothetical protein